MAGLTQLTFFKFTRVFKKMSRRLDAEVLTEGLSRAQFGLLAEVYFDEGLKQQDCAAKMGVTKGNIVQHLDNLVERGMVRRMREGRINHIHLTSKGKKFVEAIMPAHDKAIFNNLASLSQGEQRELYRLLQKLDRAL